MIPCNRLLTHLQRLGLMTLSATLLLTVVLFAVCGGPGETPTPTQESLVLVAESGGDTTAFTITRNALSCSSCHLLDGRGKPPDGPDDGERGLLFRLSIPGDTKGGPLPEPVYGGQLQDRSIVQVPDDGGFIVNYQEVLGSFADGEPYSLRRPTFQFRDLEFGPLHAQTMVSPRVAPAIVGMGLLEAIPEAEIVAAADPDDSDQDRISGRVNMVWDERKGALSLGRFGWKANVPSVEQQTAGAF